MSIEPGVSCSAVRVALYTGGLCGACDWYTRFQHAAWLPLVPDSLTHMGAVCAGAVVGRLT